MLRNMLKALGYRGIDDAVDFLMCGLATLPGLLMLCGFMLSGALSLFVLIMLLAMVGMHAPPIDPPAKDKDGRTDGKRH